MENTDYDYIEKQADRLQKNASDKRSNDINKINSYYEGYQQGIEDVLKCIRRK